MERSGSVDDGLCQSLQDHLLWGGSASDSRMVKQGGRGYGRAAHKSDTSAYARKAIGNAIRAVGRKYSGPVSAKLNAWDRSSKEIRQVSKLAGKLIEK